MFDGFISYSHAADDLLAPRLQAGLQRFAKPWWKRRALRLFRDEASLSANPHLWSSITEALDSSEWFVLLLSPDAAESPWVDREVEYWLENKDPARIIPVLTDGEFAWEEGHIISDAAPPALQVAFEDEPRWVDLRFARSDEQLDLKNPRFSGAVADVASALRGIPKDELESEEVKQHRRTIRTALTAGIALAALTVLSITVAGFAFDQQREAQRQAGIAEEKAAEAETQAEIAQQNERIAKENEEKALLQAAIVESRRLWGASVTVREEDPELGMLLALQAMRTAPSDVYRFEAIPALREAMLENRLLARFPVTEGFNLAAISPDGASIYHSSRADGTLTAFDVESREVLWQHLIPAVSGEPDRVGVSPDGASVALTVVGQNGSPGRLIVFDAATGREEVTIQSKGCRALIADGRTLFSPDGRYLSFTDGTEECQDDGSPDSDWAVVYDTATWEEVLRLSIEGASFETVVFDQDSDRILLNTWYSDILRSIWYGGLGITELLTFPELDPVLKVEPTAWATLGPEAEHIVYEPPDGLNTPILLDVNSGDSVRLDIGTLFHVPDTFFFPYSFPHSFSPDCSQITVAAQGDPTGLTSAGGHWVYVFNGDDGSVQGRTHQTFGLSDVSWAADEAWILTSHRDALLLWDFGSNLRRHSAILQSDDLVGMALGLLTRGFTGVECFTYTLEDPCPTLKDLKASLTIEE